jgi:hypothetical protein
MRYLGIFAAAVVAALLVVGASVGARAEQITISIDEHFERTDLSAACGFPVFFDFVGEAKVTLVRNKDDLVVREIDRVGGGAKLTFRSATASFSFPSQPSTWDYGEGAVVGSEVIVSFHGLFGHASGFIASDAGLFRSLGVVTGFDEFGIPDVDFVEAIADRGNRETDVVEAICAALT